MTQEEMRKSLRDHIDKTHRKVTKEEYLSLRHVDEYTRALENLFDKKITFKDFKENFGGSFRSMNKEEIDVMVWPKTIAPIVKYDFDENDRPIIDSENVQIVL